MEVDPPRCLVDTSVIPAVAPTRKEPPLATPVHWLDRHADRPFLSAVTIAELTDGVSKLRRQGAVSRARKPDEWLELVLHLYSDRVLSLDIRVAKAIGQISDLARGQGHAPAFADLAIAGTARAHGLTLLTWNTHHFRMLPISVVDPFTTLPGAVLPGALSPNPSASLQAASFPGTLVRPGTRKHPFRIHPKETGGIGAFPRLTRVVLDLSRR